MKERIEITVKTGTTTILKKYLSGLGRWTLLVSLICLTVHFPFYSQIFIWICNGKIPIKFSYQCNVSHYRVNKALYILSYLSFYFLLLTIKSQTIEGELVFQSILVLSSTVSCISKTHPYLSGSTLTLSMSCCPLLTCTAKKILLYCWIFIRSCCVEVNYSMRHF